MKGCDFGFKGVVDVAALANDGAKFIIAKASQNVLAGIETAFLGAHGNRAQLLELDPAACIRGAYHFLSDGASGRDQADFYLDRLGDPDGWLCALDLEGHPPTTADPNGTYKAKQAFDFIDRFLDQTGNHPLGIYSNAAGWVGDNSLGSYAAPHLWFWPTVGVGYTTTYARQRLTAVDVSTVQYDSGGSGLGSWVSWGGLHHATIVQFTDTCRCGGLNVDGDSTKLSRPQLLLLTTTAAPPPPPAEPSTNPCELAA